MIEHPPPAVSYLRRVEALEAFFELMSRLHAKEQHPLRNDVLAAMDAVDGGTRMGPRKVEQCSTR